MLQKKVGDYVKKGDILAVIHANNEDKAEEAACRLLKAYSITDTKPEKLPFIKAIIQ